LILVVNKVDRPDARVAEVIDEVYELFLDLDADESQIEFPIVYCNAKAGRASLRYEQAEPIAERDLSALLDLLLEHIPAPTYDPAHPLQALVTNLDASPYVGRLAICRVRHGHIRRGQPIAWCRADGSIARAQAAELYVTEALERVEAAEAGPGEIIAMAGIAEVTIGETLADPEDPRPREVITVDEPAMSVTIGVNTAPLAGREGKKLTARQSHSRMAAELVGNVSLRVRCAPRGGELSMRSTGTLVSDRLGVTATYSLMTLQERGMLFVGPGEEVYEGMIVGENSRAEDIDVNPCKEKHLTNMRSSTAEVLVRLDSHRKPTLDEALEFVREDECVEVTPASVRMRKLVLPKVQRLKTARLARR